MDIHGIKFFDNVSFCISYFEKAPWTKKAISLIQSFGTLFFYAVNQVSLFLDRIEKQMGLLTIPKNFSKKRLTVCIHGLNNNPSQFKKIVDEMQKRDLSEMDIFIPRVLQKGNAKLDEMVKPIFEEIAKWAQTPGNKELILVGISNGGRISRAIEAELTKSESCKNIKKLRVISVVGANQGSSLVNLAKKLGLAWLMSKNIAEEMSTDSKRITQLNKDWSDGLENSPELIRDYTFIASPHDWQVPNYNSTLPEVYNQKVKYALIPGHGHNSIVNAIAKVVSEIVLA